MKAAAVHKHSAPDSKCQQLEAAVGSVFEQLESNSTYIGRVAIRDFVARSENPLGVELRNDLASIESAARDALPQEDRHLMRMFALSLVSQCVFWAMAREKFPEMLPTIAETSLSRKAVVQHITRSSLARMQAMTAMAKR